MRLTGEAEYRIPFTFIEALNEEHSLIVQRMLSLMQRGSTDYFMS